MDSAMQLALMTKAKKVFGAEDTFLSFPVSPLPYTKRELDFFSARDADDTRQSLRNLQAFSTLVNLIPDDETWLPTDSTFLWDVYEQVLKEGNFAESSRTPQEEAAYQKALSYLRVPGEGGIWEDSPQLKAYRQYKDAYLLAEQKYNADKLTGETTTDAAERQRWRTVEEPAQRANLDNLRMQWITSGNKNEVEAAQAKVMNLGARSPLLTWNEWNSRFNEDLDTQTGDADLTMVYPSFFAPSNALDDDAWLPFKLSGEEVKVLLKEAPAELRARFDAEKASSDKSLTFEFSSATIQRPWFASDAFKARFWRFPDNRVLSDGGKPAKGICPAYVTAIIFARKVKEEVKPPGTGRQILNAIPNILVRSGVLGRPAIVPRPAQPAQPPVQTFGGFQFSAAVRDRDALKRRQSEASMASLRLRATGTARPTLPGNAARPGASGIRMATNPAMMRLNVARTAEARPAVTPADPSRRLRILHAQRSFQRQGGITPQLPPPPRPTTPPPPTVEDDSIYILAFICKSVPKSPNPDPTLQW